jgi:hypothetical protein
MTGTLPQSTAFERVRAYVAKIPDAIEGNQGDAQTLAVANALVWDFALSQPEALTILREYNQRCSPPWTEAELVRKLQSAEKQPHAKPRGNLLRDSCQSEWRAPTKAQRSERKAQIDPATAVEMYLHGFRCDEVELWEASPVRPPDDWTLDAIALLESLYLPGEQINFVTGFKLVTKKDGATKANPDGYGTTTERNDLIARLREHGTSRSDAGGWLRMNPLDGAGVDDDNVTAFRFALIESDVLPLDLLMPLLARLPLPTAAILTSGGRSLHSWVKVDCATIEDYRQTVAKMLALLSKFGVDTGNRNPSRLSRLPGVVRRIGAEGDGRQRLLYLNPKPIQKAIL